MAAQTARDQTRYTYRDYLNFPDDIRCEIINGKIYDMTPSPTARHQSVVGEIHSMVRNHLKERSHPCRVFAAPLDVVLAEDQIVQPGVFIVCDSTKVKEHVFGAPDVIFEVSSPSTSLRDRREKMELYERFGVTEYFIIDPDAEFVEKYMLRESKYNGRVGIYAGDHEFSIDSIELKLAAKVCFSF